MSDLAYAIDDDENDEMSKFKSVNKIWLFSIYSYSLLEVNDRVFLMNMNITKQNYFDCEFQHQK